MRGPYGAGFGYHAPPNQYANAGPQAAYNTMQVNHPSQSAYQSPVPIQDEYFPQQSQRHFEGLPTMDSTYASQHYGSPPDEHNLALSPPARAIDTTLPASFDDRGMSMHTRDGPVAASAPKRFGFGPLTAPSPTTSMATSTAFGNLSYLASSNAQNNNRNSLLGSSPSAMEDAFPRKILHSDLRPAPSMYSSSFQGPFLVAPSPPPPEDSSDERSSEELTRLPGALDDLLTPNERRRRFSRPAEDSDGGLRPRSLSGFGSPSFNSPVGSPSNASSSSRYGALFTRRREETGNDLGSSAPGVSAFGHVGSPLRKTSLQSDLLSAPNPKPSSIARSRSGNESSLFTGSGSPSARPSGLGMLSQQLRASHLSNGLSASSKDADSPASQPPNLRSSSGGLAVPSVLGSQRLDRTISTSSMGRSLGDRIEEEEPETDDEMFEMEGDVSHKKGRKSDYDEHDKKELADTSEEITPTATGVGAQENKLDTHVHSSQKQQSQPQSQPQQSKWTGGGAWNVVAAAGSRIGLTSSPKPAAPPQQARSGTIQAGQKGKAR